ncbi:MAG: Aminotran 5 protein [Bacteroidetes bacterium]|nr:Aminotran 5 protein [Bacteroidota bacterium]
MLAQTPRLIPYERHQSYRCLFPHTEQGVIYLNHAAVSPLSTRVLRAQIGHLQNRSSGNIETYWDDVKQIEETRRCVQQLINAESIDRIALAGNTSDALNIIASGLDWNPGDRVLLNDLEFPSNIYPYYHLKSQGVEIDFIHSLDGRVTPEAIYASLRPRTRILAISAVQFLSGYRAELAVLGEVCRSRGILLIVDAMQAVGGVTVDVQAMKIDGMAAGAAKWQMGPQGIGFLYLTEELQARIHQKYLGWQSVENPWDFFHFDQALAPTARRFEGGTLNIPGMWGMHAALSTILEVGPQIIESHVLALTGALLDEFREAEGIKVYSPEALGERSGIFTIVPPDGVDPTAAFEELSRRKLFLSLRGGKLRYSPHFYNSMDEIRTAASMTKEVFKTLAAR